MPRIEVIQPKEATGELKQIYDDIEKSRGQIAEVLKIQSLRPKSIPKHMHLYMEIMFSRTELSRAQREMMAVVVSVANNCGYCTSHHGSALNHYWKDEGRLEKLKSDFRSTNLSESEMALCCFAEEVTLQSQHLEKEDPTQMLRKVNLSDSAILDASMVVSYFNFVNRMVLSLGVELEQDEGKNYKY